MRANITIPGEPMGKQRHRSGNGREYTPTRTVNYEVLVKELWASNNPGIRLQGQIGARVISYFTIPKSKSAKLQRQMREGKVRPVKKPDTDNIAKIVLDSLNTVAYSDDSQVVELNVVKWYSDYPRVEVELWEVG